MSKTQTETELTTGEKEILHEAALKIWEGKPLSKQEYDLAIRGQLLTGDMKWQDFALMCYEDDTRYGYINTKLTPQIIAERKAKQDKARKAGKSFNMYVTWGIPIGEVKFDYLTEYQKIVLSALRVLNLTKGYRA